MAELQVRLPYAAWGDGEEWKEGFEEVLVLFEEIEDAGLGMVDDPDHMDDFICFHLDGDNVDELRLAARKVLNRHNLLSAASAMVRDPDSDDIDVGTPVAL